VGGNSPPSSERMKTRSQSKSIDGIKKGCRTTKVVPPKASLPEPKKYNMCRYKLRDGMAKVSLPPGFWAKIDSSARGRHVSRRDVLCFVFHLCDYIVVGIISSHHTLILYNLISFNPSQIK